MTRGKGVTKRGSKRDAKEAEEAKEVHRTHEEEDAEERCCTAVAARAAVAPTDEEGDE